MSHIRGRKTQKGDVDMTKIAAKGEEDNFNYGFAALKIFMTFEVILCHYWTYVDIKNMPFYLKFFDVFRLLAVPVFMIMSFYFFCEKNYICQNKHNIKRRLARLIIPYVVWGVIYYLCYTLIEMAYNIKLLNGISDLGWQLFLGCSRNLNPPLWFQADLIILTLLFWGISRLMSIDKSVNVIFGLIVISLFVQYSGINYRFFGELEYESRYTCGRIFEMIPFACIGLIISYYKIEKKLYRVRRTCIMLSICFLALLIRFPIFSDVDLQFTYAGLNVICAASFVVLIFLLIPFHRLPLIVLNCIRGGVKYTAGIYYLHYGIGKIVMSFLSEIGFQKGTFMQCMLILIICYIISFIIFQMPFKICKQLVT